MIRLGTKNKDGKGANGEGEVIWLNILSYLQSDEFSYNAAMKVEVITGSFHILVLFAFDFPVFETVCGQVALQE